MDAKTAAVWLTLVSAIATGYARFTSLEEAKANNEHNMVDVRGYLTALEGRTMALEKDRQLLERVHQIEIRLSQLEDRLPERHR